MKRRYITVGFTGFVLLMPLAVTSTAGWIRRLGGRRWQILHRAIYLTAIAGVIHFYWLVKSDVHVPLEYAVVMAILLGCERTLGIPGQGVVRQQRAWHANSQQLQRQVRVRPIFAFPCDADRPF
jgi:DMSO/TMAO reductase YedYZ heme-binding membrane subunit